MMESKECFMESTTIITAKLTNATAEQKKRAIPKKKEFESLEWSVVVYYKCIADGTEHLFDITCQCPRCNSKLEVIESERCTTQIIQCVKENCISITVPNYVPQYVLPKFVTRGYGV